MSAPERGFSRMAPLYRALEFLAFGGDLERARFEYLPVLRDARRVLLLGEGDGRCSARLAALAPRAQITAVDSSPGMVAQAQRRLAQSPDGPRVKVVCADALTVDLAPASFDAVVTCFFLDCFSPAEVDALVGRVTAALVPHASWLFADFVVPAHGWRRLRARAWLTLLYRCFQWETGLAVDSLPPSEAILASHGWQQKAVREWQHGLLRSAVYGRGQGTTAAPAASA